MISPWGKSALEEPLLRVFLTRRRERWLAVIWPPKRKKLRMMQALADMSSAEIQDALNRAMGDRLLYGIMDYSPRDGKPLARPKDIA